MTGWVLAGIAVVIVVVGVILNRYGVIDLSDKSRSGRGGSGMFGAIDEVFSPNRYEIMLAQERESALPAPAPVAGDPDRGVYSGRVTIKL